MRVRAVESNSLIPAGILHRSPPHPSRGKHQAERSCRKTPDGDPPQDCRLTDCRGRPLGGGRIPVGISILPIPTASVPETEIRQERGGEF